MKKLFGLFTMLAAVLLIAGAVGGCTKDLTEVPGADDSQLELEENEYGLGFNISLDQLSSATRASHASGISRNDVEDYVDTEHLHILFFNLDGIYLFNIDEPTAVPIGQTASGNDRQWFIKIPVKEINDNLVKYIEEHPFKIAVLANWTYNEDINIGGQLGSNAADRWEEFQLQKPLDAEGNLTYDSEGKLKGDHISLLTHCQRDTAYDSSNHGYDHLVSYYGLDGKTSYPHMGPYTEWVWNFHKNIAQAEADMRQKYDVVNNRYVNPEFRGRLQSDGDLSYPNMWRLWHFSDDMEYNSENAASINTAWKRLNDDARAVLVSDGAFSDESTDRYWKMDADDDLVIHGDAEWVKGSHGNGIKIPIWDGFSEASNDAGDGFPAEDKISYFHFYAKSDGYLRIKYETVGNAKLKVHLGLYNFNPPADDTQRGHNVDARDEAGDMKLTREVDPQTGLCMLNAFGDVPSIPKHIYIYCLADPDAPAGTDVDGAEGDGDGDDEETEPAVIIYEVEYISSRHLYDVDREGVMPSKEYPIPMYGIQDFEAIGEYWQPGILFNLSTFNNAAKEGYSYRTVSLLRSLARVEVVLSKSAFPRKPSHVFIRSMNRSSRITPVDLFTPTDIIWNGFNSARAADVLRYRAYEDNLNFAETQILQNSKGVDGEIDNIRQFGPIYIGDNTGYNPGESKKMADYRKTTAWHFGIWEQQWNWNWNRIDLNDNETKPGVDYMVEWFDTYSIGDSREYVSGLVPQYPQILHTRISRSDYARFHDISDEDPENWHYIIYLPEKNITDADEPGDISDRPKICHVELRFNGGLDDSHATDNVVNNLDDNGAYRLYFTDNGAATGNVGGRDKWDSYEYNLDYVKNHWPIVRNHVYIFNVTGGGPDYNDHSVTFQVCAPDSREASWNFY